MRVVIVSAYRIGNETGTAKVSERLSRQLAKKHKVLYLCLGEKYSYEKSSIRNLYYLKIPSELVSGLGIPIISPLTVRRVYRELDNFAPNIIHAQNIVFGALISLIWAKKNKVPFVLTFHSLPSEGLKYIFPKIKKGEVVSGVNRSLHAYVKEFVKHTDLVVALNESVKQSLQKIDISTKLVVIGNGLDLGNFYKLRAKTPKNIIRLIYLGSYISKKNQEFLLRTFKFLPRNYSLSLYGNRSSGHFYARKLDRLKKELKLKNVFINDFIDEQEVLQQLERAHYFVSSSVKEVQSLVVIEALAAGLPVISLKNETTEEVIDGENGMALPQNTTPKKFAREIQTFVEKTNPKYSKVANYCRKSIKRFGIETISEKLVTSYKTAIKDKKREKDKSERLIIDKIIKYIPDNYRKDIEKVLPKPRKRTNVLKILLSFTVVFTLIFGGVALLISRLKRVVKS